MANQKIDMRTIKKSVKVARTVPGYKLLSKATAGYSQVSEGQKFDFAQLKEVVKKIFKRANVDTDGAPVLDEDGNQTYSEIDYYVLTFENGAELCVSWLAKHNGGGELMDYVADNNCGSVQNTVDCLARDGVTLEYVSAVEAQVGFGTRTFTVKQRMFHLEFPEEETEPTKSAAQPAAGKVNRARRR